MKIAYLMESVGRTGGNVVLFKHMAALSAAGHEVSIVTPYGSHPLAQVVDQSSSSAHFGYFGMWGALKAMQLRLRKVSSKAERRLSAVVRGTARQRSNRITERLVRNCPDADIVIATHSLTAFAAAQMRGRASCFYHMQGFEPWFSDDEEFSKIAEATYHLPLFKIANCSWLAGHLSTIGASADAIVYPGVDHTIFRMEEEPVRPDSHDVSHPLRVVSYCDPRPLKGWADSVEAMKAVIARTPGRQVEWHVFGHGDASLCPIPLTHHGFLPHEALAKLYRSADVLFVPSWLESFPLQPLEAMACGIAVVTTKTGTEDFARDGVTALVVPPQESRVACERDCETIGRSDPSPAHCTGRYSDCGQVHLA